MLAESRLCDVSLLGIEMHQIEDVVDHTYGIGTQRSINQMYVLKIFICIKERKYMGHWLHFDHVMDQIAHDLRW
jgi:hypothetical protein